MNTALNNKNFPLYLCLLIWLGLALFTLLQYQSLLAGQCAFQSSWLLCWSDLSETWKLALFAAVVLLVGGLATAGLLMWRNFSKKDWVPTHRSAISWGIAFLFLAALAVPFGSNDTSYFFSAGQAVSAGNNLYTGGWTLVRTFSDPASSSAVDHFSYGPITATMLGQFFQLSGPNPVLFVAVWKLFTVLLILTVGWLTWQIGREMNLTFKKCSFWLLWLSQPLLLFEWLVNGHFDGLWLATVLLAFLLAKKRKWFWVWPLLAAGVWIKFLPALTIPFFALWWWQGLDRINWRQRVGELVVSLAVTGLLTYLAWVPYWQGWQVFDSLRLQSKWAVMSIFSGTYYSLQPAFAALFGDQAHWFLTRLLHLALLVVALYLLTPLIKQMVNIVLRKSSWQPKDYLKAIFITLLVFLLVWQKSVWPWYFVWLLPFAYLVFMKGRNVYLGKIIAWISVAPLGYYVVWLANNSLYGSDATELLWFQLAMVGLMVAYPLYNLFQWRRSV